LRRIRKINKKPSFDRYLLTYADLITLLLGLFIILYASSSVSGAKFKEMKNAFDEVFSSGQKLLIEGGDGVLDGTKSVLPDPAFVGLRTGNLSKIQKELSSSFAGLISSGDLNLRMRGNELVLELPEELLFQKGKADLNSKSLIILDSLAYLLEEMPNMMSVDGHTDSDSIRTFQFESNWHLSVERALNVAYSMIGFGLSGHKVVIRGFGDKVPIVRNDTDENKRFNRRVEIVISEIDEKTPISNAFLKESDVIEKN
jgi:chemotaxis protein MotB